MSERLYFDDPYCFEFAARVVRRGEVGGHPAVVLDRTAFYPEGGGQPADHGTLGGARVVDVRTVDGVVWHVLDAPLAAEDVAGVVDRARRLDHLQQHHGQHLLSAAFEELYGLPTLAFHLGAEYASIDLPGEVSASHAREAEGRANAVIWENREVIVRFVTPEELAALPLRKRPAVEGPVRVVSVPGFDYSACGGTHPRHTGEVGLLHVRRRERRGNETRIEFLCGGRVLADLRRKTALVGGLAAALSVGGDEVEEAVGRLRDREAAARKRAAVLLERLVEYEARELVRAAPPGAVPVVAVVRDDLDAGGARLLAHAITGAGGVAVVGARGEKAQVIVARPPGSGLDCAAVLREALGPEGGRGGGQPALAQGGLPDPSRLEAAVERAARLAQG